jgi:MFS family permease
MISECTTEETSIQAYSYQQSAAQLTIIIAPLLGGVLYDPTRGWPWLATKLPFLQSYPALLPAVANACLAGGALLAAVFGLGEVSLMRDTGPAKYTCLTAADQTS